jgi:hypothetical protein
MLRTIKYNCRKATLLSLKKEGHKINMVEQLLLTVHLRYCESCRRFVQQSQMINQALAQMDETLFGAPTHRLSDSFKTALKRQIGEAEK